MAIYHCSIKNIGRSGGKSAVAAAAYRAGEKLEDLETGLNHDYTKKGGIEYTEIILCKNAPSEYQDRATLWNEVQKIEKVSNARFAREWEIAIPRELTLEEGQKLVKEFGQSLADEGMCVDISIHDKNDGNRHAHILGTTRPIKENGEWGAKEKKAYALDEHGERIPLIDSKTGEQKVDSRNRKQWKRESVEINDWNKKEKVEEWRERWANYCNKYLQQENQIDHRSYERQGKEQLPTVHEGYVARQIEQRGGVSERCEHNREITEKNSLLKELRRELNNVKDKITTLIKEKRAKLSERIGDIIRTREPFKDNRGAGEGAAGEFIRKTRASIASKRDERANRDAERERQRAEREQKIAERERAKAERSRGFERDR